MNKKIVKNVKILRKMLKIVATKKALKLMIVNQILIVSTPIIVVSASGHVLENFNTNDKVEEKTKLGKLLEKEVVNEISEKATVYKRKRELTKEKENYVTNVAEFYGVDEDVVDTVIKDITENKPEKLIDSTNPEMFIIDEIENKIVDDNITVNESGTFTFADTEIARISEIKNSEVGAIYEKYGKMYGIDPNLLMAKDMQESGLKHDSFNPVGAYGISQIEHTLFYDPISNPNPVHVFNYEENEYEDILITESEARKLDTNIKYGAAKMQEKIRKYKNNIFIALQSYNYGISMETVIYNYSAATGISYDEILANTDDFGWLEYVTDFHNNPNKYTDWPYGVYGDDLYISHIMRYISDGIITIKDENGNDIVYNLKTNKNLNLGDHKLTNYIENEKVKIK